MKAYVFIDVSRKQEYIFRHKSLRNNLVNSWVIKAITEVLDRGGNPAGDSEPEKAQERVVLGEFLQREYPGGYTVVYSGGGNSILQFADAEQAGAFIRSYSLAVLRLYPQLELYISKVNEDEVPGDSPTNISIIRSLLVQRADALKDKRRAMFRRWSYGIERLDESGKPVVWGKREYRGSSESDAADRERLEQEQKKELELARNMLFGRLEDRLEKIDTQKKVEITVELKSYKTFDDRKSYLGVIAIDGNKMGEMFRKLGKAEEWSAFSRGVEQIYADAVADALHQYADSRPDTLYVTPVLMSGDDICLVTHAENALDITARVLEQIHERSLKAEGALLEAMRATKQPYLTACAGVAIVRVAYPFFDAVQIAERLCRQAKEALYRSAEGEALSASLMDWEIVQGQVSVQEPYEKLTARAREHHHYRIRPLRVDQERAFVNGIYSYKAFRELVESVRRMLENDGQAEEAVSRSFLEKLKKQLYQGWESYQLLFKFDQTGSGEALSKSVEQIYCPDRQPEDMGLNQDSLIQQHAALIQWNEKGQRKEYKYVLNDVLEALAFTASEKEAAYGDGK